MRDIFVILSPKWFVMNIDDGGGDAAMHKLIEKMSPGAGKANEVEIEDGSNKSPFTCQKKMEMDQQQQLDDNNNNTNKKQNMPPASVMTRLILIMVWRKLIRNPNTYSSLLGVIWSLVSYRWNIQMPSIVKGSISILSDAGLGMAMFSLGTYIYIYLKLFC